MKKLICALLVLVFLLSVVAAAGKFTDVKESDWYYSDVENAVELGLINGKGNNTYCPNENLTYAEAVKLAACMHEKYTKGKVTLENGNPWYAPYLEYCFEWGILDTAFYSKVASPTELATRSGYMEIFSKALPDEALKATNYVPNDSIPDVKMSDEYAEAVYKLYRAGIVAGSDAAHNCKPDSNIKRSEVAAILSRMMDKSKRVKFSIGDPSSVKPLYSALRTEKTGNLIAASAIPEGGMEPYTYRWQGILDDKMGEWSFLDGMTENVDIEGLQGVNDGTLTYKAPENAGLVRFRCVVTDALGFSFTTEAAEFKIEPPALKIKEQPKNYSGANNGDVLVYSVKAEGGKAPYTYVWGCRSRYNQMETILDGEYVTGANTDTLSVKFSIDNPLSGKQFYCVVTDSLGNTVKSDYLKLPEGIFLISVESFDENTSLLVGTVTSGSVKLGEYLVVYLPVERSFFGGKVEKIEMFGKSLDSAGINDRVGITLDVTDPNVNLDALKASYDEKTVSKMWNKAPFATKISLFAELSGTPVADVGQIAIFEAVAVGGKPPYTFKWQIANSYSDGYYNISEHTHKNASGVNTPTLIYTVYDVDFLAFTEIRCLVSDSEGNVCFTNSSGIIPSTRSYVYSYPKDVTANYGDVAQFSVGVIKGNGMRVEYQWQIKTDNHRDFVDIESVDTWAKGAQTATLSIWLNIFCFANCFGACNIRYCRTVYRR